MLSAYNKLIASQRSKPETGGIQQKLLTEAGKGWHQQESRNANFNFLSPGKNMMSKFFIIGTFSVFSLLFLAGCKEEPAKTRQWYIDHPEELKVVYEKCQKSGIDSDNCRNVQRAKEYLKNEEWSKQLEKRIEEKQKELERANKSKQNGAIDINKAEE